MTEPIHLKERKWGRPIRLLLVAQRKFKILILEKFRLSEIQANLFWAGVVGFFGALASVLFRRGIALTEWLLTRQTGDIVEIANRLTWWQRLIVPTFGGLIAGLILQLGTRLFRAPKSADYMEAIVLGEGRIRTRQTLIKSLSSMFTIASGGSIGREGPIVQLSALVASTVGRMMNLSPPRLKLLIACGAASGIASAYNAPIAGALFVAEIILGSIAMPSFGPLVFSSVIATLTVHQLIGVKPTYDIPPVYVGSNWEIPAYILLGLVAGTAAPIFLRSLREGERLYNLSKLSIYARFTLGGIIVGIISIFQPAVWGNGYSMVDSMLRVPWAWQTLVILLLLKLITTTSTVGSGAVGGVFTPTLFMGAVVGSLFGQLVHVVWIGSSASLSTYALVAMGCFLAATTHAPLMAILMLFEMTLDYSIILPLMLGCVTAYYTAIQMEPKSIYDHLLHPPKKVPQVTKNPRVRDLMKANPVCVKETDGFDIIAQCFLENRHNYLYVVNEVNDFRGVIALQEIKGFLHENLSPLIIAADIMNESFPRLTTDSTLGDAVNLFFRHDGERLPVVKSFADPKLLGSLSKSDLLLSVQTTTEQFGLKS